MKFIYQLAFAGMFFLASCGGGSEQTNTNVEQPVPETVEPEIIEPPKSTEPEFMQEIELQATGAAMSDMAYSPAELHVPPYVKLKLNFKNMAPEGSGMIHNAVVVAAADADAIRAIAKPDMATIDDNRIIGQTRYVQPGASEAAYFETPAIGEYLIICTYPGHQMMVGKLVVQ